MLKPLLFSFLFLLFFLSPVMATTTLDYTHDLQDSMTYNYSPTTKYGNETAMNIMGRTGYEQRIYMLWDISDIPLNSTINSAYLSIWQYASGPTGLENVTVFDTALNWNEANITWNVAPTLGTGFDTSSYTTSNGHWYNISIKNALQDAIADVKNLSIAVKTNATASAGYTQSMYYTREYLSTSKRPYLTVNFTVHDCESDCGDCGCVPGTSECYIPPKIGAYVDNTTPNTIVCVPYANCTNTTYTTCPAGTTVTQITPEYNFSGNDIWSSQNNTNWCAGCIFINWQNPFKNNEWTIILTNCFETGITDALNPVTPGNLQDIKLECECAGPYCANMYTTNDNSSFTSVIPEYTAGCWNNMQSKYYQIINSTCTNTTVDDLVQKYVPGAVHVNNSKYMCDKINTTSDCYDINCNLIPCTTRAPTTCQDNALGQLALVIGSGFGLSDCSSCQAVFSILASLSFGILLLYFSRKSKMGVQAFIFGALGMLVMFTVIGWFYSWLMILLMVLSAFLMAKQLGFGGGG